MKIIENSILALTMAGRMDGPLKLDKGLFNLFLSLSEDPLPVFRAAAPGVRGRGKDHPRYGRWMRAFVRYYKPDIVVEVGTNAGGTAVGTARALVDNGRGRLICIDNGEGVPRSFPDVARSNIEAAGLKGDRAELICEDSGSALPRLASRLKGSVGVYLVDAAHTYDAALADIKNGIPMMAPGGFILVHDVDSKLDLADEVSPGHPAPVLEAFKEIVVESGFEWCILKFIRKHLGVIRIPGRQASPGL
jgi:predicted O-methyltransferase YrrM